MMTTTQVVRTASWRVGQTTLRSSKRDSDRNSRVCAPLTAGQEHHRARHQARRPRPARAARSATGRTSRRRTDRPRPAQAPARTSRCRPRRCAALACSTLLFIDSLFCDVARRRLRFQGGTPGGTRTPNLRFWRPLLCQLSYWRIHKLCTLPKRQRRLAPPRRFHVSLPAIRGGVIDGQLPRP